MIIHLPSILWSLSMPGHEAFDHIHFLWQPAANWRVWPFVRTFFINFIFFNPNLHGEFWDAQSGHWVAYSASWQPGFCAVGFVLSPGRDLCLSVERNILEPEWNPDPHCQLSTRSTLGIPNSRAQVKPCSAVKLTCSQKMNCFHSGSDPDWVSSMGVFSVEINSGLPWFQVTGSYHTSLSYEWGCRMVPPAFIGFSCPSLRA